MNGEIPARDLIQALGKSQKVTNAVAMAVTHLAKGDAEQALETLQDVVDLAAEAQWYLAELAYNAGLADRG